MKLLERNDLLGRIVYSKAGRDKDKYFIIVGTLNETFVYISDGELRKLERPKKKKIKHLIFTDKIAVEIQEMIYSGKKLNNSRIKKYLEAYIANKEV